MEESDKSCNGFQQEVARTQRRTNARKREAIQPSFGITAQASSYVVEVRIAKEAVTECIMNATMQGFLMGLAAPIILGALYVLVRMI